MPKKASINAFSKTIDTLHRNTIIETTSINLEYLPKWEAELAALTPQLMAPVLDEATIKLSGKAIAKMQRESDTRVRHLQKLQEAYLEKHTLSLQQDPKDATDIALTEGLKQDLIEIQGLLNHGFDKMTVIQRQILDLEKKKKKYENQISMAQLTEDLQALLLNDPQPVILSPRSFAKWRDLLPYVQEEVEEKEHVNDRPSQ
jgi:hypothetical protein